MKLRATLLIALALILTACSTTPSKRQTTPYKKPPAHVTVGQGVNRAVAEYAMRFLGTPYYYGGSSPAQGFDCSGLIQYSAKKALGINMPRTAAQQSSFGKPIELSDLQAGDIVFFNTTSQPNSHSGIYLGETYFVHAPSSGGVVRVDSLTNPYWQPRINLARRIQ